MSTSDANRKTALITGATSGIGFAFAKVFAHEGFNVVLVGRDEERLLSRAQEISVTSGVTVTVVPADLQLPTSVIEVYRELQYHGIAVDVLVNNAGVGVHGYFAATDWQKELEMISVNILALSRLTKLFLGEMLSRGSGKILNVASTAAFQPGPLMAVYYATKAYVLSFSVALHEELRGSGITVTTLCPGPTRTNFFTRAKADHVHLFRGKRADPAVVARAGYAGLMAGRSVVVPGFRNTMGVIASKVLPHRWTAKLVRWLIED